MVNVVCLFLFIILINIIFSKNLIKYEEIEQISIITFTSVQNENSFIIEVMKELNSILNSVKDKNINVLIITNEGDNFFSLRNKLNEKNKVSEYKMLMNKIYKKIEDYPIPVIAVVNGNVIGDSFELVLCCDFIICSEDTYFGFENEDKYSSYEFEKPERLLNFVEKGIAKKITLVKDKINSYEAYRIGLVNSYHPQNQLFEKGIKLAKLISSNSKIAIKNSKLSINEGNKITNTNQEKQNEVTFLISIHYKTQLDEAIYILGNISDFGYWKGKKYKMDFSDGYIWKTNFRMKKSDPCIQYKFVCISKSNERWENGQNRLLCPYNLEYLPKISSDLYELNLEWNRFHINFNLYYPLVIPNSIMRLGFLEGFTQKTKKPIEMEFNGDKIMIKNNNKLSGIWTVTVPISTYNINNNYLDLEYRYSLFDLKNKTAIWEREPNRKLRILFSEGNIDREKDPQASCFLLKNSKLEFIDVNFVATLDFNKIGDFNIYIGPYPQTEQDFESMHKSGINTVLNVQTDKDLESRQLDINILKKYASKYDIKIERYPIEDFNPEELYQKLKGAGDLLNNLLVKGKNVYVHCTAGISRGPSVVIIYLVLYHNYSFKDAVELCKKYRPKTSPNYDVIKDVIKIYIPNAEF